MPQQAVPGIGQFRRLAKIDSLLPFGRPIGPLVFVPVVPAANFDAAVEHMQRQTRLRWLMPEHIAVGYVLAWVDLHARLNDGLSLGQIRERLGYCTLQLQ